MPTTELFHPDVMALTHTPIPEAPERVPLSQRATLTDIADDTQYEITMPERALPPAVAPAARPTFDDSILQTELREIPQVSDRVPLFAQRFDNRYDLQTLAGVDRETVIVRSMDRQRGQQVALHFINAIRDDVYFEVLKRFRVESHVLSMLQHPSIVYLRDFKPHGKVPYLVTEFLHGETLRNFLNSRNGKPMDGKSAMSVLRAIIDALTVADRFGIVHRCICPEHVMLMAMHRNVKLFGFGNAYSRHHDEPGHEPHTTKQHGFVAYRAPEQALSSNRVDCRADMYSIGVMAYEMFVGHRPFSGSQPTLLLQHQILMPVPPAQTPAGVSAPLSAWIMKMLAKQPEDRYPNFPAALAALNDAYPTPWYR